MKLEINGAGFQNKGAELMLRTTVSKLRQLNPDTQCFIAAGKDRPPFDVGEVGAGFVWPTISLQGRHRRFNAQFALNNFLSRFISPRWTTPYGLATRHEIDGLVDISGYAFGDHWGLKPMQRMTVLTRFYKRHNKPVIMMPQMLGPFEKQESKRQFSLIAENCTAIYARDPISLEAAQQSAPNANIKLCPDITICMGEKSPLAESNSKVCIVPNVRMVSSGDSPMNRSEYVDLLVSIARTAEQAELEPVVVVHDSQGQDQELADAVVKNCKGNVEIVNEPHPLKLKKYIANSHLLVGSRFHSLVAALSSDVPVVAIGWAHKYRQLLRDYGQEQYNLEANSRPEDCLKLVQQLLDPQNFDTARQEISAANIQLKNKIESMWLDVQQTLSASIHR